MVKQVSQVMALSNSGLSDWVVQRATAVILTLYFSWVMAFFLFKSNIDHTVLTAFFGSPAMKVAGTLAVVSTVAHAWIGMWTIGTDYLRPAHVGDHATSVRFAYQAVCLLVLFVYLTWAMRLVWQF
jgi:succinate dehydrogenase / fumarate reductase membrane anchor subunit